MGRRRVVVVVVVGVGVVRVVLVGARFVMQLPVMAHLTLLTLCPEAMVVSGLSRMMWLATHSMPSRLALSTALWR